MKGKPRMLIFVVAYNTGSLEKVEYISVVGATIVLNK